MRGTHTVVVERAKVKYTLTFKRNISFIRGNSGTGKTTLCAGIGTSFRLATQFADRCIVAATPDPASLRDAACAADALALEGHELLQLVVNRVQPRLFSRMNLTVDDMMDQTGLPLLGLVPEDPAVVLSAAAGKALILNSSGGAAEACLRISRRLRGEPMPLMRF